MYWMILIIVIALVIFSIPKDFLDRLSTAFKDEWNLYFKRTTKNHSQKILPESNSLSWTRLSISHPTENHNSTATIIRGQEKKIVEKPIAPPPIEEKIKTQPKSSNPSSKKYSGGLALGKLLAGQELYPKGKTRLTKRRSKFLNLLMKSGNELEAIKKMTASERSYAGEVVFYIQGERIHDSIKVLSSSIEDINGEDLRLWIEYLEKKDITNEEEPYVYSHLNRIMNGSFRHVTEFPRDMSPRFQKLILGKKIYQKITSPTLSDKLSVLPGPRIAELYKDILNRPKRLRSVKDMREKLMSHHSFSQVLNGRLDQALYTVETPPNMDWENLEITRRCIYDELKYSAILQGESFDFNI